MVYVVGKGRSGSTLLDGMLGSIPGWVSTGELFRLWCWGVQERTRCTCGAPVPECPVWSDVLARVQAALPDLDPARVLTRPFGWHRLPRTLGGDPGEGFAELARALYGAIAEVTGARVVVDSSKWPAHPVLLGQVPGLRGVGVNLVRDPRAVAFSWTRVKPFRDRAEGQQMPRYSAAFSALSWTARQGLVEVVRSLEPQGAWLRLRYEDLVRSPHQALSAVAALVGEAPALDFVRGQQVRITRGHMVGGNPSRDATGTVALVEDAAWRQRVRRRDAAVVGALSGPLARRYGYPLLPSKKPA